MNNTLPIEKQFISNLKELELISSCINKLQQQIDTVLKDEKIDSFERKIRIKELKEEITLFENRLLKGIHIDCDDLKKELQNNIVNFLQMYGFKNMEILERFQNIEFYITNERLSSGGLLASYSNKIAIDYTLCDFDDLGKFLDFKIDKKEFIKYALTHEFLHILSIHSILSFKDDPLSEGYTDLFARNISQNQKDKSEKYDFFVRVCTLLTNFVGIENTLDDYFNNLDTLPNLKMFFIQCGIDNQQFLDFQKKLNQIMDTNSTNLELVDYMKKDVLNWLRDYLVIPYLKENVHEQKKENYVILFNNLFNDFNVDIPLEEITLLNSKIV